MLWLTVTNELTPQNIWRYRRGVALTDIVITGIDSNLVTEHRIIFYLTTLSLAQSTQSLKPERAMGNGKWSERMNPCLI
jgi:hypothetical protein